MAQPLDETVVCIIDEGTRLKKEISALDVHWKVDRSFVSYQSPPVTEADNADLQEWQERISFIEEDLHWLLRLPHDKFWCQVVFDESLHLSIDSYLKLAPRSCDVLSHLPTNLREIHDRIHRMFFMVCLRMATYKESKECFITPEVFGDILYENFIFDIAKLMDLTAMYGSTNGPLVSKMIANIFTQQPKYQHDLRAVVPSVLQLLQHFMFECGIHVRSTNGPEPITSASCQQSLASIPLSQFKQVMGYLADTARTLQIFLDLYQPAARIFAEDDFLSRLASAYESIFNTVAEAFKTREFQIAHDKAMLQKTARSAQVDFVKVFHQVLFMAYLQPIMDNSDGQDVQIIFERYLETMTLVLAEKRFIAHLEMLFPFEDDLDLLMQCKSHIDDTSLRFIGDAMHEACRTLCQPRPPSASHKPAHNATAPFVPETQPTAQQYDDLGACAALPALNPIEVDSAISAVKDLLPELGDGFVEACLEQYSYNTESVINAILDNSLPACLQTIDRTLPKKKVEVKTSVLDERRNVYDDDEFDVFHQDVIDTDKIHLGKKEHTVDIDDKSHLLDLKPLYQRYGNEFVESMYEKNVMYEDEYDDTYDSNAVGADDADSADEMSSRREKPIMTTRKQPRAPPRWAEQQQQQEEEDDRDDTRETQAKRADHFIEDPAKIRERQAQRWATRQSQKPAVTHDVKGATRGQGQSADTLHNRAWKEKHKSSRVNHNRRAQAERKRRV